MDLLSSKIKDNNMTDLNKKWFPIKIQFIKDGEIKICNCSEAIPPGKEYQVLETQVVIEKV